MPDLGEATTRLRAIPWNALAGITSTVLTAATVALRGVSCEDAVYAMLRAQPEWNAAQRRVATETVFGLSVWRRRLAAVVGADAWETCTVESLLFAFLVERCGVAARQAAELAGVPVASALHPLDRSDLSLGVRLSFPDWLVEHFRCELPASQLEPFLAALNLPAPVCLRANPILVPSREWLREHLLRKENVETELCRFAPWGLRAVGRFDIRTSPAYRQGWFEVQDEGSQLLGHLVEARAEDTILELCAGAGGKTLLLAGQVGPKGRVHVSDVDAERLDRLRQRVSRAGATERVEVHSDLPPSGWEADRVMVDAPCSELGPMRRHPDLRFRLKPENLCQWSETQLGLLRQAASRVRVGGWLVYATCTVNRAENEKVIERFLAESHGTFSIRQPALEPELLDGPFYRSWPHRHGLDGFFGAQLKPCGPRRWREGQQG